MYAVRQWLCSAPQCPLGNRKWIKEGKTDKRTDVCTSNLFFLFVLKLKRGWKKRQPFVNAGHSRSIDSVNLRVKTLRLWLELLARGLSSSSWARLEPKCWECITSNFFVFAVKERAQNTTTFDPALYYPFSSTGKPYWLCDYFLYLHSTKRQLLRGHWKSLWEMQEITDWGRKEANSLKGSK